jgi:hypothetical protein
MKRSLVLYGVSGLLALAGCGPMGSGKGGGYDGPFAHTTPTEETVALAIPEGQATAASEEGVRTSALLGDEADSYKLTRAVTVVVNGGTAWVLGLVKLIVSYPPTRVVGTDTAVWAPAPDPLAKKAWRLSVTRVEPQVFDWKFDAKAKADPDSAFITILSGRHTRAVDGAGQPIENYGSGNFTIDWNAANTLPREVEERDHNVGVATFSYARVSPTAVTSINVDFNGVEDDKTHEIHNAIYRYVATPGAGGDFKYGSVQDNFPDPGNTGTAKETMTIHSRWLESGAGRSDYRTAGSDVTAALGGDASISECWNESFASVYMTASWDATAGWGAASSCAFTTAEFSSEAP